MILVVSDLHLGREPDRDAAILSDLSDCVAATEPTSIIFVGDVFDAFVETPGRIPPPVHAWSGYGRTWIEKGISIRYLMGNHDRWHRSWIEDLTGRKPIRGHVDIEVGGQSVRLEHGDAGEPHGPATRFARWFSNQRLVHRLFTLCLPFGGAQALAAHVSRKAGNPASSPTTAMALEIHARKILGHNDIQGILMGHAHRAALVPMEGGKWYLNTGNWYLDRTFALLDEKGAHLARWGSQGSETLETVAFGD